MAQADTAKISEDGIPIDWPQVEEVLHSAKSEDNLYEAIVNTPFSDKLLMAQLGLGIIVFLLVDDKNKNIHRVALSDTYPAQGAVTMSAKKFEEITIPLNDPENIIAKAITTQAYTQTTDWHYLFTPDLTAEQARFNQAGAGIATSIVYPLSDKGAMIFSFYMLPSKIGTQQHSFMQKYSQIVLGLL